MFLLRPLKEKLSDASLACLAVALFSALALALALAGQYALGLEPCVLCLYQRIPYTLVIIAGLAGVLFSWRKRPKAAAFLVFMSGLLFLSGAAIAFYHTGVEQHWWVSALEGCKVSFETAEKNLLERIMSTPAARCDEIPWTDPVFNLSMAVWNVIVSLFLAVLSMISAILIARKANGFL